MYDKRLYLASKSPRRAQLLMQIGIEFELIDADVDETPEVDELAVDYVGRLAKAKALAGWNNLVSLSNSDRLPVLGADTCIVHNGQIMGKPQGQEQAAQMLRQLSGQTHQVLTGVSLYYQQLSMSTVVMTDVTFKALSDQEIENYWASGEPEGKAGSYAIQGLGAIFVEQIRGSYSAVVGLPLAQTWRLLNQMEQEVSL